MKISHLQENLTPSSAPSASVPGPKFGRSDEMLESGVGATTAGAVATGTPTNMGVQRRGKKSIFKGIKTSEKYANSRKAGISEDAINEDDLSEEQLQAKQRREDLFNRAKDRDIGNRPKSREIMARESGTIAPSPTDDPIDSDNIEKDVDVTAPASLDTKKADAPKSGSWQEIAALNNITDPRKLQADKPITLPNGDSYYVNKGDTLSGIANRLKATGDPQYGEPGSSTKNIEKTPTYVDRTNVNGHPSSTEKPSANYYLPTFKTTDKLPDVPMPPLPDTTSVHGHPGPVLKTKPDTSSAGNSGYHDPKYDYKPEKTPPAKATPQPDIHSQASQDAQWEKDKQNMGNAWDDFKNWVKKPRSFNIVPGKDKPPVDPSHDIGQRAGLSPDEIVKRLQSMPGAKDDTPPAKPQKSTSSKTSSTSPDLSPDHKVIAGIESGNKDYKDDSTPVVSPKGAQYAMQVMKNTNRDPGYGVKPAQDSSPEESNRVGRDYYNALLKKHDGDKEKAAAAYNAGPGRLDKILAKAEETGKNWRDLLPRETRHYVRKFNKGTAVSSNNDDSMNEDISQKYARDYDYILTYLLAENLNESRPLDKQIQQNMHPDTQNYQHQIPNFTLPIIPDNAPFGRDMGSGGASFKSLRPGLQKKTADEFNNFLSGSGQQRFDPQQQLPPQTVATPAVIRKRGDPNFKNDLSNTTSTVDANPVTVQPTSKTNPNFNQNDNKSKYDPTKDAGEYNSSGDYLGGLTAKTSAEVTTNAKANDPRPGLQRQKDKEDREAVKLADPDNIFKSQADPGLPFKPIPPKFDATGEEIDPLNGLPNFYYESKISRIGDEYEQILESLMGKLSLSEERTETKNEKGEVTSWREEGEWRKAGHKNGRGRVTNLSDKARRETEKLTQQKEVAEAKPDFAAKFKKNIDKHNTAVIKTKKEIGTRVADIGPGGKEYNVKTDKEWDKQKGVTEMNVGKRKPKPDSYHINKDGKPGSKGAPTADALRKSAK